VCVWLEIIVEKRGRKRRGKKKRGGILEAN
jgi:hypothetical protein